MTTVADLLGQRLYAAGCRHSFGIPGGEVLAVMRGIDAAGVTFTLVKHENSGGFMAEGAYHRTGAPGVLIATLGPGVANAANVVANALQDRVPLLFITGCVDEADAVDYTHQVFDHAALMRPITKASLRITPAAAATQIDRAIAIAMADPPGPVHIDVPISVATQTPAPPRARTATPAPSVPADLTEVRQWLAEARWPVLIAGVEALHHNASDELTRLVELGIPLITTYKAKGTVDERNDFALGAAGLSPLADELLQPLVQDSDLILLAGYDPIEMRVGWRDVWSDRQRVVEFSATPPTHSMHASSRLFVGDIRLSLRELTTASPQWTVEDVAHIRRSLAAVYRLDETWGPGAVVDVARAVLPPETIASVDSGAHRILLSQAWTCHEPRSLMQSSGLCTMGCSLPLGLGAKLAEPGRPVAVFTGDACLEMTLGELATARDTETPVIVFVFADESLSLIETKQRGNGMANLGVDFSGTDFAGVGQAMGGLGFDVRSREELTSAIKEALAASVFSVISCHLPRQAYDGRI